MWKGKYEIKIVAIDGTPEKSHSKWCNTQKLKFLFVMLAESVHLLQAQGPCGSMSCVTRAIWSSKHGLQECYQYRLWNHYLVLDWAWFLNLLAIPFVFLAITFTVSGVQNNSEYSTCLLVSPKSTFVPSLPINGKYCHSASQFFHMPC
jgi:hypothetical protein